ncbi:MAG: hypothetical protein U1F25_15625 [Rubrivivax sp.]
MLEAAHDAGASRAFGIVLRLPWEVSPIFQQWLAEHLPDRAARVMARIRGSRRQGQRPALRQPHEGVGVWAELVRGFESGSGQNRERHELDDAVQAAGEQPGAGLVVLNSPF